jgi:hypothetical protein
MTPVSDDGEMKGPLVGATQGSNAIGVPSAELSLGWLLASRANLRFTRQAVDSEETMSEQEQ